MIISIYNPAPNIDSSLGASYCCLDSAYSVSIHGDMLACRWRLGERWKDRPYRPSRQGREQVRDRATNTFRVLPIDVSLTLGHFLSCRPIRPSCRITSVNTIITDRGVLSCEKLSSRLSLFQNYSLCSSFIRRPSIDHIPLPLEKMRD
jgi:hypothetical protein